LDNLLKDNIIDN
jgi:hypothetical protein